MFKTVRNWLKLSALSVALMGCSDLALANTVDRTNVDTNASAYKQALQGQTLRVGAFISPPFAFISDSMSNLHGIDVDIIRELQKRTGFKLEGDRIVIMNFDEMMENGKNGRLDIMGGGITLSRARQQFFDFSAPVMTTTSVLVRGNNSHIDDVSDLHGRKLAAQAGSIGETLFENSPLNVSINRTSSAFMSLFDVYSHNSDAVIIDRALVEFYQQNWPDSRLHIVQELSEESNLGLLFKKNALVNRHLQDAYQDMIEDGTVQRIVSSYISSNIASTK